MNTQSSRRSGGQIRPVVAVTFLPTSTRVISAISSTVRSRQLVSAIRYSTLPMQIPLSERLSAELVANFYEEVPLKRELGEFETFYAIDKAHEMLGFTPQSRWR